jgi:enoyl-CoA hydratase/carnithine racemase
MKKHVDFTLQDGIAVITMDSPPVNAFTDALHDDFRSTLAALAGQAVRVAIITGTGRYFQAGGDMNRFLTLKTLADARAFVELAQGFMNAIAATPYPTIAALNGYALGGGLEIALACDIRVASSSAILGLPEARYGILAGAGGTQRLARLVGPGRAKLMMYAGGQFTAAEALEFGLVEQVSAPEHLLARSMTIAREIAGNSPIAVRHIKHCVDQGLDLPLEQALALERDYWADLIPHGDYLEGVQAWLERRRPNYPNPPTPQGR